MSSWRIYYRIPAAWNSGIGLKPTRGRVIVGPNNWRFWQGASINFGLTRSIKDTALLLDAVQAFQNENVYHYPLFARDFINILSQSLPSLTIGYTLESPIESPVSNEAQQVVIDAITFKKSSF